MNIRVGHHCRNHQVCLDLWLIAASFDLHRLTGQQTACTEHKHSQPSFHSLPPFSRVSCQRKTCPFGPQLSDGHEPFVTPLRHGVCCGQRFGKNEARFSTAALILHRALATYNARSRRKWRTTTPRICSPARLIFSSPWDGMRVVFDCVMTTIASDI